MLEAKLADVPPQKDPVVDVFERLHIGARCTGAMERLLTLGVEYATHRVQFDQRIYDFQGVSFPLADSAADASAATTTCQSRRTSVRPP